MESEEINRDGSLSIESNQECIQRQNDIRDQNISMSDDQSEDPQIDINSSFRDQQMSIESTQNQTKKNSLIEESSLQSLSQIKRKIHKNDEQKGQKRGRKPKLQLKKTYYDFKTTNLTNLSDLQSQFQFETNIMKPISNLKVFFLAGDILAELKEASHQMGIDLFFEQRNALFMENLKHGTSFEVSTNRPLKNFQSVIYQMENSQDQKLYEFSQFLKKHQELVYMISSQIQDLQNYYQFNPEDMQFIIDQRQKIIQQQRKQLLEQIFNQDQFSIIATVSLALSNQTTTISNICLSKSMMALIGCGDEQLCDIIKLGFFKLISQKSRKQFMLCNVQAQQALNSAFKLDFDDLELTTFDLIKIICKGQFQTIPVKYPENLKFDKHPLLNMETFYVIQFDITPWHIEQVLKLRREYKQKAPQNENFPYNYNYSGFVEFDIFEYTIQSQIFLEKYYQKELDRIQQQNQKKQEEQYQEQINYNKQQCGYRYL
ncbi:hypothetical protein TTHERM_00802310 (macronuclear) [Tetrahymena thermophila SB210]|uniref:Uncharacterized protein n=1 Tax=Tetrahymena thermophila (strain SB210) TaxID=312017 RepID=Q235G9_TETTS|nr:hypothetical protein TTHERM_00802310 [Tetrahymena thermophila SB210]EAR92134.1 hypothetical protein TTHERM_00802310 [Tetrahymena thermophila SB210]|eukprot:XP_001012379.1 hypothetical protein TTHERM_00802310 [Tetrahymena thermophila SB210]